MGVNDGAGGWVLVGSGDAGGSPCDVSGSQWCKWVLMMMPVGTG